MQHQTDDMMAGGMCSEQGPVQHMGKHRQRMPVAGYNRCQGPLDIFRIETGLNMIVADDVPAVIKTNKFIARDPSESDTTGQC